MYCLGTSLSVTDDWQCLRTITFCQNRAFSSKKRSHFICKILSSGPVPISDGVCGDSFIFNECKAMYGFNNNCLNQTLKLCSDYSLWGLVFGMCLRDPSWVPRRTVKLTWLDLVLWLCMPLERGSKRNTGHFRFEWRKVYCWCWNYETLNVINLWQPVRTTIQVFLFTSPTNTQSNTNWNISIVIFPYLQSLLVLYLVKFWSWYQ